MATAAQGPLDRITAMGFFERGFRGIVATKAEGGFPIDQKVLLVRTVGKVTGAAPR